MTDRRPIILVLLAVACVLAALVAFDIPDAANALRFVAAALAVAFLAWFIERL